MLTYFDKEVNFDRIFGRASLVLPNPANAKQWMDKIENALSPENLSCDGELPRAQVLANAKELHAALAYVKTLLPTPRLSETAQYELAFGAVRASVRRQKAQRTQMRAGKLSEAIRAGFTIGVKVRLSNGLVGKIVKINRTRVKVMTETRGMWNVPPNCMKKA